MKLRPILKGTLILTITGLLTRCIGFFYRIFLSNTIGAKQLGIYQLLFPLLMLLVSLCGSGISLVISRQVAICTQIQGREENKTTSYISPGRILSVGLTLSIILSVSCALLLYFGADWLSDCFLGDRQCAPLLRIAAYSLPLSAIHMCIEGYYFGQRKTTVPAIANLGEQLVRVFSFWLLCRIALAEGRAVTVRMAVYGLVLGEAASSLIGLTALSLHAPRRSRSFSRKELRPILLPFAAQGIPLTANRVILNLLQSIEAVCIPARLQQFGLDVSESLRIYGILTGMSMPFILFPTTLTNAASTMLLPTAAKAGASHETKTLQATAGRTLHVCLLLGLFCTGIFVSFGHEIGEAVFHNTLAGTFLAILGWICPLLYISSTFASILHGLGKTTAVFGINLLSIGLRLLFVVVWIPRYGILAYLWGMLCCHLISTFLYGRILMRTVSFSFSAVRSIVLPSLATLAACLCARLLLGAFSFSLLWLIAVLGVCGIIYLLSVWLLGLLKF